jgi:hypothetical protein
VEKAAGTAGGLPKKHPKATAKVPQNGWKLRGLCAFRARIMCNFGAKQQRLVITIAALSAHNLTPTCAPQHHPTSGAFCNADLKTLPVLYAVDPHLRQFLTPAVLT